MINFIIKEHPELMSEISKEDLVSRFNGKLNIEILDFIIDNQDELEVTYYKNDDAYRFDFVKFDSIVSKYISDEKVLKAVANNDYKLNIDLDLKENELVFYDVVNGIGRIIDADLVDEEKMKLIKSYKDFQKATMELGFRLDIMEDTGDISLVCKDIKDITLEDISVAFSKIETYNHEVNSCLYE